jgi:hypothetical protein
MKFDGRADAELAVDFDVITRLLHEAIDLAKSEPGAGSSWS